MGPAKSLKIRNMSSSEAEPWSLITQTYSFPVSRRDWRAFVASSNAVGSTPETPGFPRPFLGL